MKRTNEQQAMRASRITIYINVILTVFKLAAGVIGNSTAMIADAMHSFSDMYTTFIVMIGVKLANKKSDKDHPYGHERFECVAAILLAVVLVFTGAGIGWSGISKIIAGDYEAMQIYGFLPLAAAVTTITVKAMLFLYKRGVAKKVNSAALMADAWHHLSDSLSSIGSFIGILGAMLGFPIFDPLAAVVICLFIFKVALDVFRDAVGKMTDKSCGDDVINEIRSTAMSCEGVLGVDDIKTRLFGYMFYLDIEISADGGQTLSEAHVIAKRLHDILESQFEHMKHCMVHVNPHGDRGETTEDI
jgi:cation diffusion facilitator family transporter